jgi:PAS domain S-box-containing protein
LILLSGFPGRVKFFVMSTQGNNKDRNLDFHEFFQLAVDLLCIADAHGNFLRVNQTWTDTLGYTREELEHHRFMDLVHPDDQKATRQAMEMLQANKPLLNFVNRYRHKDGSYLYIEWRSKPHKDLFYAAARDITHRVEALQREKHLNALLDAIRSVNQIIVQEDHPEALLRRSCDALVQTLGFHNAWVVLVDESKIPVFSYGAGFQQEFSAMDESLRASRFPHCVSRVLHSEALVVFDDPANQCADCPLDSQVPGRAGLAVPMEHRGRLFGVLIASVPAQYAAVEHEQQLFRELGQDLGNALHKLEVEDKRRKAEHQLRERVKELACFSAMGETMMQQKSLQGFCREISGHLKQAMCFPDEVVPFFELDKATCWGGDPGLESGNMLEAPIIGQNKTFGNIRLYYPAHRAFILPEEQNLLNHAGWMIGLWYENKLAQQELFEKEENLRITLQSIGDGMIATDMQGRVTRMNPVAETLTGWSLNDAKNRHLREIFPIVNAFTRKEVENPVEKVIKTGHIVGLANHTVLIARDGKERQIADSAAPIRDDTGQFRGVILVFSDVSEKYEAEEKIRQSERLFRTLVENAFDGIYLAEDSKLTYVNNRFSEIVGYSRHEILESNLPVADLVSGHWEKMVKEGLEAMEEGDVPAEPFEMEIITRQGQAKTVEVTAVGIAHESLPFKVLGVMRDITHRKQQLQLEQEVAIARQAAQFKQNFLANMSHEIRTPLTGIIGISELLSATPLEPLQREYINTLLLSTQNLREIINQILDYSKIEAGEVQLRPRQLSLNSLVENAESLFRSICHKDIRFESFVDEKLPARIKADELRVTQILNNLLSNAVKFTHSGYVRVSVVAGGPTDQPDILVKVLVEDTGIGIAQEAAARLFQPFSQVETEDTRNYEGTGLGLIICRELAALLGGSIGFDSQPGKGSTFWFTFKAAVAGSDSEEAAEIPAQETLSAKGLRILFVEDKPVNQKVISLMLTSLGHKVTTVSNGRQAISTYKPGHFDLILMDIQMPVMDGVTATQKLKAICNELPPIVGLSANAFEGDREKYMKQGMDEYLTKPVQGQDLNNLLKKLFPEN